MPFKTNYTTILKLTTPPLSEYSIAQEKRSRASETKTNTPPQPHAKMNLKKCILAFSLFGRSPIITKENQNNITKITFLSDKF